MGYTVYCAKGLISKISPKKVTCVQSQVTHLLKPPTFQLTRKACAWIILE